MPVPCPLGSGALPSSASLVQVEGVGVVLTSLKAGEDGGIVLRLVEHEGKEARAKVSLHSLLAQGKSSAESVDLIEGPDSQEVEWDGVSLFVTVPPFGIRSVRLS
jgi:hypothetical protein